MKAQQQRDIATTKTMAAMISEAQQLYDMYNWGSLDSKGHERLVYLRNEYKKMRGEEMQLTYNCPA